MRALLPVLLLFVLAIGGCDSNDLLVPINVTLTNDSLDRTHLMHESESFASSNQVVSNESRTVRIEILDPSLNGSEGTPQIFRAGRNGEVLTTVSCRASRLTESDTYQVVFNRNGTLSCVGW